MVDMEEWKQIDNYENYEVSSYGNVRNKKTRRILKMANKGGYSSIGLSSQGKTKSFIVHRLLALAFLENPNDKPHVNHIDKNRSNNILQNLEWATASENNIHKCLTLEQTSNQNLKVWRVDIETGEKLELYNSIQDAAKWCEDNNYSSSKHTATTNISNVIRGVYKKSCGFKWLINIQPSIENEIWKNININGITYDKYQVSSLGRFKNYKGVIMENYKPHHSGYIYVRVNYKKYGLHQLVASTFIDNSENKHIVNHIDGNKTNNCVTNLEWCNVKENNQHNHNIGLIKTFKRKIGQYNLEGELIKEYISIVDAEKELGVQTIKKVLYNKQKTAGGFIWKYLD